MLFDNKVWWMPACPNAAGKAIKTAVKVLGWVGIGLSPYNGVN